MKEWIVRDASRIGSIITFPDGSERAARRWMAEHAVFIRMKGSPLFGATLDFREWESPSERIEREHQEMAAALRQIHDFAHDRSTGPAVPDSLWEVRSMASTALEALA